MQGYMNLKLGVDKVYAEMEEDYEDCVPEVSLEEAINIIQRNERGRQGKARAMLVKRVRESEKRDRCSRCFWEWFVRVFHQLLCVFAASCLMGTLKSPAIWLRIKTKQHRTSRRCFVDLLLVAVQQSLVRKSWYALLRDFWILSF